MSMPRLDYIQRWTFVPIASRPQAPRVIWRRVLLLEEFPHLARSYDCRARWKLTQLHRSTSSSTSCRVRWGPDARIGLLPSRNP